MIGGRASDAERSVVREFFELFKTPWEFYNAERRYDVVLCSNGPVPEDSAKLILVYGSEEKPFDRQRGIPLGFQCSNTLLSYGAERLPIYGKCLAFDASEGASLIEQTSGRAVNLEIKSGSQRFVRVGFDLFGEVRHLLSLGQPLNYAGIPALEIHIAFLRDLLLSSVPLVEIPPVPAGYTFIVCLTHDVDHVGIRNHKCDHTMFGFLYRASIGSFINLLRRRKSSKQLVANWAAALSLPLVHLGLMKDFWYQFDRYLEVEKNLSSTFFVIPCKGDSGQDANGACPSWRAAHYDIGDIPDEVRCLLAAGHEVGLHGIDAWRDAALGRKEFDRVARATGTTELGVRMHWLFFDKDSPVALENAGFSYDSTVGYNETIGYRAGTTQAFKPPAVQSLLELPMHVMDTALFFPTHMNLSPGDAAVAVASLVKNAAAYGGVLTINWHDRSLAPERLWDDFYITLLADLKTRGAWFPNAGRAISWFRKRRAAVIESVTDDTGRMRVKASLPSGADNLPGLRIRVHRMACHSDGAAGAKPRTQFTDIPFDRSGEMQVAV